jgi:putative membrane protein
MFTATVAQQFCRNCDDHTGGGWWWVMGIGWLVFLAALVVIGVVLFRHYQTGPGRRRSAEDVLDERFARGEMDVEEYRQRRDVLRG